MGQPKSGDRFGSFELVEELGRGGMGIVFRAHDRSLGRDVALKILTPGLAADEHFVARFQREARTVAALNHPYIVGVLSCGEQEGTHYFAMEYVPGRDLGRILDERGRLPVAQALSIAAQIASALEQASARGIVHRDIKPSNILIDESGRARVTDFGIARSAESQGPFTMTGQFLGTVEYASPEQARGEPVDARSDVYSLGALLYRTLSGQPPVSGSSPVAVLVRISNERPTPLGRLDPSVPAPVCDLVERMMDRDPDRRPQTPAEVIDAIRDCERELGGVATAGITETVPVRHPAAATRPSWAVRVGAAAGALAAVVLLVWTVESEMDRIDPIGIPGDAPVEAPPPPAGPPSDDSTAPPIVQSLSAPSGETLPASPRVAAAVPRPPAVASGPPAGPTLPPLPEQPRVLVLVSGDEPMVPAVRAHLESLFQHRGLHLVSTAQYPVLREKVRAGGHSLYWYDVVELLPANTAQILVLAEIHKTGSTTLRYYGRSEEMTLASFSVRTLDATTGASIHSASAPSIEFTALNMGQNLNQAIETVVAEIGGTIQAYWKKRRLEHDSS